MTEAIIKDLPVYHFDIEQGTPEWHELRAARATGSDASAMAVKGKKSLTGLGTGAITLLYRKSGMLITGESTEEGFKSDSMDRGHELEPLARKAYEDREFETVKEVGFISKGLYLGTSPDGLVGDHGMIEIKCFEATEYCRSFDNPDHIDKSYYCQIQWGLFITGRKWCDYVVFHPNFGDKTLLVRRFERDETMIELFEKNGAAFGSEMKRILDKADAE